MPTEHRGNETRFLAEAGARGHRVDQGRGAPRSDEVKVLPCAMRDRTNETFERVRLALARWVPRRRVAAHRVRDAAPLQPVLETERLVLRPLCAEDARRVAELANDRSIAEQTRLPYPYLPEIAVRSSTPSKPNGSRSARRFLPSVRGMRPG